MATKKRDSKGRIKGERYVYANGKWWWIKKNTNLKGTKKIRGFTLVNGKQVKKSTKSSSSSNRGSSSSSASSSSTDSSSSSTDSSSSSTSTDSSSSTSSTDSSSTSDSSSTDTESDEDDKYPGFFLHQGDILETYHYYNNFNGSYDDDYTSWKGTGKIKYPYTSSRLKEAYKGVRCLLKIGRYPYNADTITIKPVFLCFITDSQITNEGNELTIEDEGRLLEEEDTLSFSGMLRSEIIKEVIRTAGLTPEVDFTDLQDDVISWTSASSSGSDSSNSGDASQSGDFNQCSGVLEMTNKFNHKCSFGSLPSNITKDGYAKIGDSTANYASFAKGKSPEEIMKGLRQGWKYCCYACNRDKCASESYTNRTSIGINCGDSARLVKCCMDIANVNCIIIHNPGHFYNAIQVNGEWKTTDLCYRTHMGSDTNKFGS